MLLYTMLYIVLAYLMLFPALTNSVCLNNASFFFLFKYFLCQGYELSGEIAHKNNHYYYYYYYYSVFVMNSRALLNKINNVILCMLLCPIMYTFERVSSVIYKNSFFYVFIIWGINLDWTLINVNLIHICKCQLSASTINLNNGYCYCR